MNTLARSCVGRNVNLHLKDRSVLINVHVTQVQGSEKNRALHYKTPNGSAYILLEKVDWIQPLNSLFNPWKESGRGARRRNEVNRLSEKR